MSSSIPSEFVKYLDFNQALISAARDGDLVAVTYFCTTYPELDVHIYNESAFRLAAANNHLSVVKYLIEKYPNINVHAFNDEAFRLASAKSYTEMVEYVASLRK